MKTKYSITPIMILYQEQIQLILVKIHQVIDFQL